MDGNSEIQSDSKSIDRHVGARVRAQRRSLGVSQERLAHALDLTFQQIQKYERGDNRISASKLFSIARFLRVPVAYFFEALPAHSGMAGVAHHLPERLVHAFLVTPEGIELATQFTKLPAGYRRRVLELVRTIAEVERLGSGPASVGPFTP